MILVAYPTHTAVSALSPREMAKILQIFFQTYILRRNFRYIDSNVLPYRKTSNISRTLVGNKVVDNSDVIGASPVGAAPTTSSFST